MRAVIFCCLLVVVLGSPLEKNNNEKKPQVVDIPADLFSEDSEKDPSVVKADSSEDVPVEKPKEDVPIPTVDEESDDKEPGNFFGIRLPTFFVYRRPVVRDPYNFPSFSPFSSFSSDEDDSFADRQPARRPAVVSQGAQGGSNYGMMSHMESMMQRMQQQMQSLWSALATPTWHRPSVFRPTFSDIDDSSDDRNETSGFWDSSQFPANYTNSTSETKFVDGQLVTVNKTVHKISTNNSSGFFQVSIINVRPKESAKRPGFGFGTFGRPISPTAEVLPVPVVPSENKEPAPVPASPPKSDNTGKDDPSLNEVDTATSSGVDSGLLE